MPLDGRHARAMAPHIVADIGADGAWREHFAWPLAQPQRAVLAMRSAEALQAWFPTLAGLERQVVALAGARFLNRTARILVAAGEVDAAARLGIAFRGSDAEADWLSGSGPQPTPARGGRHGPRGWRRRVQALRDLRNTFRLLPPGRAAAALLAPQSSALNFGPLLRQAASVGARRVRYREGAALLARARAGAARGGSSGLDVEALAVRWTTAVLDGAGLPDAVRGRAAAVIGTDTARALAEAEADLAALAQVAIGDEVWAGSGGNYALRAIGLAVLRRGGTVTRFAHGGAAGLDDYIRLGSFIDLLPSSRFVVATQRLAEVVADRRRADPSVAYAGADVAGASGDPVFRAVPARNPGSGQRRPRVLYVTTLFTGTTQHLPPTLADPVYFDWQLRLLDMLRTFPCELVVKPHPENHVLWNRQPIEPHAVCDNRPFRTALAEADVLLFDFALTTAFWEALCSDRPVVLVQPAGERLNPALRDLYAARLKRVDVRHDERNRPTVDSAALAAALADAAGQAVDPAPFRALLAGDA